MNNGYSICFNEWALDKDIKNDLGLLLIISSLCAEKGYCFASNKYLAKIFDINEISISRKIKKLERKKYIEIEYEKKGCEVITRKIRLTKMLIDDYQKGKSTINKNVKENNISNNIISNNIYNIYGEFQNVKLTEEEYKKLEERNLLPYIEKLSSYIASKGKKYKSHYATILTWSRKEPNSRTEVKSTPKWFNETIKNEDISTQEQNELEKILKEIGE